MAGNVWLGVLLVDPQRRSLLLLLIIYLGYISLGLPDGTLGVAWPAIYPELKLPLGLAGTIMTIGTVLTGLAGFSSGWIISRWRTGPVVFASGLLTASGMFILSQAQGALWLYAAAIPLGLGAGAVDAGLNGYVARHYSGRHMNWLHACWGIGATSGPFVIGWALGSGQGWRGGYLLIAGVQYGLALLFLLTLGLWAKVPEIRAASGHGAEGRLPMMPANSLAGWLSPVIFALYVAVECTTGLWAGTVLVVRRGISPETAALCIAGFFGSLTVGRILVGFVVERWGNRRLVGLGCWTALAGFILFGFATNVPLATLALAIAGFGLAPIYPGLMHEVPRRFAPEAVQTVIGRQSGGASFGAAVLPALAGWVAQLALPAVPWLILGVMVGLMASIRYLNRIT
ncbi:Major Facilitator Superfamily protein [Lacunisphaera limnophila]|uniref:Major Facilitator Superfamily protein n=1 Tax=Lacunisphaera limnophila TaxID=1838286 RepID=A0A1D8AYL4_9BACT|nr:Major Facilitator Superfamily protein [Lacunisphaera limnophila]